jgi:CelD/BcsL family acetyltransferase involved in cellulose biosynthesis
MLEVLTNLREMTSLEEDWNLLADRFQSPLARYEWFMACVAAEKERQNLSIFILRKAGKIRAIAPLKVVRRAAVPTLQMIGYDLTQEPTSILYSDLDALQELLDGILIRGTPVVLNRYKTASVEENLLQQLPSKRAVCRTWQAGSSPFVPVGPDWTAFETRLSSSSRSYIKRRAKRAKQDGGLDFEAILPTEETALQHFETFMRIEASGWKGREGTAVMTNPLQKRFLTIYSQAAAKKGLLHFFFLKIGGQPVAGRMAIENGNRLWELKIGYDEAWQKYSPGILLVHETLRYASERGLEGLEFMGYTAPWHKTWPLEIYQYNRSCLYPTWSVRSGIPLAYDTAYYLLRDVYRKMKKP